MNRWLNRLEEALVIFFMATATLITFAAVLHRYLSGFAIPVVQDWLLSLRFSWSQELTIILFVWMAKFGAAYGVRTGIHVGVDVLINRLAAANRRRFIFLGLFSGALFTGIIGTLGVFFVWENGAHYAIFSALGQDVSALIEGPITPDLEWPTWVVYSAIPLGSSLMCFRFLQVAWGFSRTGELPHHDHSHVAGLDEDGPPAADQDDRIYRMDDNLHAHGVSKDDEGRP
ncbi:MAG: TRAP transporter small permease [Betaproteobacteria bacterium]|nr:MAG: TRAP transporter small permease [Betaproteobacteria bacterium]